MNTNSNPSSCPKCGAPIPSQAPQGLCPQCVLAGAASPTDAEATSPARHPPPAIELVRAAFPQLEVLDVIGAGGMGVVYLARQPKLDRLVALKILPEAMAGNPVFVERFNREARVLARLNHPNIVSVFDFGQAGDFCYLLMEFVDGVNLRQAMRTGRFSPAAALAIVPKICDALQFAHERGILHRDIKPENILLDTHNHVKIADFGIAKLVGDTRGDVTLTASGASLGTPHYMAPEQIEKPGEVDQRADIYSLGVVFYEMLTGELPIGRFAPPSSKTPVDSRVDDVVFRALEKEREKRFQSASEVKTSVEDITAHPAPTSEPSAAPTTLPAPPGLEPAAVALKLEHKPLLLIALAIVFALLLARTIPIPALMIGMLVGLARGGIGGIALALLAAGAGGGLIAAAWRNRTRLLSPLGITETALLTPDLTQRGWSTDRLLGVAAVVVLMMLSAQVAVQVVFLLLALPGFLSVLGWTGSVGLAIGAVLTWSLVRTGHRNPTAPLAEAPAWVTRVGVLFLGLGGIVFIPTVFSGGEPIRYWRADELLAVTGIALLTRNRTWRTAALGINCTVGLLNLSQVFIAASWLHLGTPFMPWANGQLPAAPAIGLALLQSLGFVAGVWVLCRRDVKACFGIGTETSGGQGAAVSRTAADARVSRKAVWSAVLVALSLGVLLPFSILAVVLAGNSLQNGSEVRSYSLPFGVGPYAVLFLVAATGTVLGFLAWGDIRHSAGQLRGKGAAMFGALAWPVTLVLGALFFVSVMTLRLEHQQPKPPVTSTTPSEPPAVHPGQ